MKQIKFVSVGESNIGKTKFFNLLLKIEENHINYTPTIGVSYFSYDKYISYLRYKCKFWDTGGGKTFQILIDTYLKESDACILFFDYKNNNSLQFITEQIEIFYKINPEIILLAVGFNYNHKELSNTNLLRFMKTKKYLDILKTNNIPIFNLHCFTHFGIKDLMDKMICKFIKICHEKNIVIKDKEPSFAEELNKKENKHSFFEKIKDIMCCSCCYIA